MEKRKGLSKKLRFEVFKRDKFTCQYCGEKSPDVVLHVDHIKPVAAGGGNELLNLITSCQGCNQGKGARELSDDSAVIKQRDQLEDLADRREQIDMMLHWRDALMEEDNYVIDQLAERWSNLFPGAAFNDHGEEMLRKLIKKFGVDEVLEGMDVARDTYGCDPDDPIESANHAGNRLGGILMNRRKYKKTPHLKDLHYSCGILRNRLTYFNRAKALSWMEDAVAIGIDPEDIKDLALSAKHWTQFRLTICSWIDETEPEE